MTDKDLFEHFKKYKKLSKKAQKMIDTTEIEHANAYNSAVDLIKDDEGLVDYEKLDDNDVQKQFADKMADYYISKARKALNVKPGDKEDKKLEDELLMNAYAGVTTSQLKESVSKFGKKFTFEFFNTRIKPQYMQHVERNLKAASSDHLEEKHIPDIVKYTKTGKFVNPNKITLDEAVNLMDEFHREGVVSPKSHKGKLYYRKDYDTYE